MKLTDEAVDALSVALIGAAWGTFDEGLRDTLRGIHREALEAALPHLTDDGAAATPPADTGVRSAQAAESATPVGAGAAAPSSPHLSREAVMAHYHSQFCEYDGKEDGVDVCAGECREFAEEVSEGATPAIDREGLTELLRFNRHAPYVSNERLADMVTALIAGAS